MKVELETTLLAAVSDLSTARDLPSVTRVVRVAARTLTGADARTTRRFGGLGIGLTIVQELVALHGGAARASSDGANQGTSVRVEFPILQAEPR